MKYLAFITERGSTITIKRVKGTEEGPQRRTTRRKKARRGKWPTQKSSR